MQVNTIPVRVFMKVVPDTLGRRLSAALQNADIEVLPQSSGKASGDAVLVATPEAVRDTGKQEERAPTVIVVCGSEDGFFDGTLVSRVAGIVDRDDDYGDLCRAVRSVAAGHGWISPHLVPRYRESVTPAANPYGWETLTGAERRTAELVLRGKSNKQTATVLGVSEATIKSHLTRAYAKLSVQSRAELIALVSRLL